MRKLLLTGAFKYSSQQMSLLEELGYEVTYIQDEREKLEIDVSDIEVVVCNGLFLYNSIESFKSLKLIQLTSAGFDRVPMDYIKSKGIKIYNAHGVYSIPMAEWVISKILDIYKSSFTFYDQQRRKEWIKNRDLLELYEKKALIMGYGSVGKEVAKRLYAFDVEISTLTRKVVDCPLVTKSYLIDELDVAISRADIVILSLPYTTETHHLVSQETIYCMKKDSLLVNVSRGSIIDEGALIKALNQGKFLGVALDVFETEPLAVNSNLWNIDRVIITPHNSFVSDNISKRMFDLIVNNLQSYMDNTG